MKRWSMPLGDKPNTKRIMTNDQQQINVYCRFRPIEEPSVVSSYYRIENDKRTIEISAPEEILQRLGGIKRYYFSHVFNEKEGQEDVFKVAIFQVLKQLHNKGKNGLVFSYGVTNAGKTYTMVGNSKNPGVIKNCFKFLFDIKQKFSNGELQKQTSEPHTPAPFTPIKSQLDEEPLPQSKSKQAHRSNQTEVEFEDWFLFKEQFGGGEIFTSNQLTDIVIKFQSFEIYNEDIYDLLGAKPNNRERKKLTIKEVNKKIVFEDILTKECHTLEEGLECLNKCLANRSIVETMLNSKSSRSHCVFKILIEFWLENDKERTMVERYINIVDLAGSERTKRTENVGNKLKEANKINQSLSCLGRCLSALKESKIPPYRETKLTRYLSEFFIEENFIIMIANINPQESDFEESIRVLNYASIAREIRPVKSKVNCQNSNYVVNRKHSIGDNISNMSFNMTEKDFDFKDGERSKRLLRVNADEYETRFKGIDERIESLINIQKKFFEDLGSNPFMSNQNKTIVEEITTVNYKLMNSISGITDELKTLNRRQNRQETLLSQLLEQMKKDNRRRSSSTLFNSPKSNRPFGGRKSDANQKTNNCQTRLSRSTDLLNKDKREPCGKDSRDVGMSTDPSLLSFPELPRGSAPKKNRQYALKSMKKNVKKRKLGSYDNQQNMKISPENVMEKANNNRKGTTFFSRHDDYKDISTKELCQITQRIDEEDERRMIEDQIKSISNLI